MTLTRRGLLLSGMVAAGAIGLASCGKKEVASGITLGLTYIPSVQFAPFYIAVEQKLFSKRGLDVKLRHHGSQEGIFGALLSGEEHVVCASSDEAVVATSQGQAQIQTFATMYQMYPVCLISRAELGAKTMRDLAGKRIGSPGRFGSTYYGLRAALSADKMTETDIQLVETGYTGVAALAGQKVDAIVGFANNEPLQFAAQNIQVTTIPVVDPAKPRLVGPGLMVRKDALPAATLRGLAEAVLEAEKSILADPAAALKTVGKYVPDLSEANARANAERVLAATSKLWLVNGKPSIATDGAAFQRMSELLFEAGITKAKVDPKSVVAGLN